MSQELVLTIVARDRPGLVERLSEVVTTSSGNWIDSSMARLGGEFAGILRVAMPDENVDTFESAIGKLADEGIIATVRRDAPTPRPLARSAALSLTGIDHPGIVHAVARVLSDLNVSIDQLETEVFTGSMSGEAMFSANATVLIPEDVAVRELRGKLERLAQDVMVEIELVDPT